MSRALVVLLALGPIACNFILPGGDDQTAEDSATPGEDLYIAVGDDGALLSSADATTWTVRTSGVALALHAVTWGADHYVAVGQAGTILESADGVTWNAASSPSTRDLYAVVHHDDRFFAVGGDNSVGAETLVSFDGRTWTRPEFAPLKHVLTDLASDGANLVTLGTYDATLQSFGLFTWTDGTGWTQRVDGGVVARYDAVAAGSPAFVAIGNAGAIYTEDTVTWTSTLPLVGATEMKDLIATPGGWLAVGVAGQSLTSSDGLQWVSHAGAAAQNLQGVTAGGGLYVAVGDGGTIVSSGDGVTWTAHTAPLAVNLHGIAYPGA